MQMKSAVTYSELIPCFGNRFARNNIAAVSSGIQLFMSALSSYNTQGKQTTSRSGLYVVHSLS